MMSEMDSQHIPDSTIMVRDDTGRDSVVCREIRHCDNLLAPL